MTADIETLELENRLLRARNDRLERASDVQTLQAAAERITGHNIALRSFLLRLLDPDDLGHAVTAEVRQVASGLLVMERQRISRPVAETPRH